MNNKLMKDDPVEVMDEKAALKENLVKHVLDQLPNALQAALPALNAYPNDPGVLLLTVTAALIDRNPDQALRFLHRFTKNWQSREYEDQLLRAIALARQGHWPQAAMIGKQVGWPNLFGAFIHLPGSWALRDWAHGWVRQIERYEDRQKRSVAAKKGLERRKAGVATPVQNSLVELYNLLTLLKPGIFKTEKEFRGSYMTSGKPRTPANKDKMRDLMRDVMIRNTRSLVDVKLPPRHATTLRVDQSEISQRGCSNTRARWSNPSSRRGWKRCCLKIGSGRSARRSFCDWASRRNCRTLFTVCRGSNRHGRAI